MKVILVLMFLLLFNVAWSAVNPGFYISDHALEASVSYKRTGNLIVFKAILNDSISVNLLFDTGCRSIVLFGKKYQKMFNSRRSRNVTFNGIGNNDAVFGFLVTNNTFQIGGVSGTGIPIVIASANRAITQIGEIDGVIGYDLFSRFEIEVNPLTSKITFRDPFLISTREEFSNAKLQCIDAVPVIDYSIHIDNEIGRGNLLLDTGSQFSLLLQSIGEVSGDVIAIGLNGSIKGEYLEVQDFYLGDFSVNEEPISAYRINTLKSHKLSLGMDFLKDYFFIINIFRSQFYFKKIV